MTFNFDGSTVNVIHSKRKTISIEIKDDGILVRAPLGMKRNQIHSFLLEKNGWIKKHQILVKERKKKLEQLQPYTEDEMKALVNKAKVVIPEKVKHYAAIIGVDYGRITIRNQRTRWGSCSSKGNLNFNCILMLFPDNVIDSVVVHELCHRKHMNHSAKFYAEVEKAFPDYFRCHRWLKENGGVYLRRIP